MHFLLCPRNPRFLDALRPPKFHCNTEALEQCVCSVPPLLACLLAPSLLLGRSAKDAVVVHLVADPTFYFHFFFFFFFTFFFVVVVLACSVDLSTNADRVSPGLSRSCECRVAAACLTVRLCRDWLQKPLIKCVDPIHRNRIRLAW